MGCNYQLHHPSGGLWLQRRRQGPCRGYRGYLQEGHSWSGIWISGPRVRCLAVKSKK